MEAKIVEDIKDKMLRRLLLDGKVPETSMGTRVAAALGQVPAGPATGFLEEIQVNNSFLCQTGRIERHQDGPGFLKLLEGIEMKWQMHRGGVHPVRLWPLSGS